MCDNPRAMSDDRHISRTDPPAMYTLGFLIGVARFQELRGILARSEPVMRLIAQQ